jgi:hypothetical protein
MGCRLVAVVRKLRPKKMTRIPFYVATAFATANVRMLGLKQIRYIFLRKYAYFSICTYVAVFLNKRLRQCYGRKFASLAKC